MAETWRSCWNDQQWENRPTRMIGTRNQFFLDGRRGPLIYQILITLWRIISCTDDSLENAKNIFNGELGG